MTVSKPLCLAHNQVARTVVSCSQVPFAHNQVARAHILAPLGDYASATLRPCHFCFWLPCLEYCSWLPRLDYCARGPRPIHYCTCTPWSLTDVTVRRSIIDRILTRACWQLGAECGIPQCWTVELSTGGSGDVSGNSFFTQGTRPAVNVNRWS